MLVSKCVVIVLVCCFLFLSSGFVYLEKQRVLLCACAKCGSTSLWVWLYQAEFGDPWPFTGPPYVYEITSRRWKCSGFRYPNGPDEVAKMFKDENVQKFALIRDPRERLISAWKSKVTCDHHKFKTDLGDRPNVIKNLFAAAAVPNSDFKLYLEHPSDTATWCLTFNNYLQLLVKAVQRVEMRRIDPHLRLQRHGCFEHFGPEKWTEIWNVADMNVTSLAKRMGDASLAESFPHSHASTGHNELFQLTEEEEAMIEELIAEDAKMLEPYLKLDY